MQQHQSCSEKGNLLTCVLCGSVALRALSTRAKLYALYSQMSDVEAGGATVFPDLGAAIWPKKVSSSFCGSQVEAPSSYSLAWLTLTVRGLSPFLPEL